MKPEKLLDDFEKLYILLKSLKHEDAKELSTVLSVDSFLDMVNVFGGTSIYIPTKNEVDKAVKLMQAFYYRSYENKNWYQITKLIPEASYSQFRERVQSIIKDMGLGVFEAFKILLKDLEGPNG